MLREQVTALIAAELSPILGRHTARAAVDGHCASLGLGEGELREQDLAELLRRIGLGLCLFVGRDKAEATVAALAATVRGAAR